MNLENAINETAIILQARTGSTRLPNKIFKKISGKPILWHIVYRLKLIHPKLRVILATSDLKENECLETFAKENNILFFAGSEDDVLDRYYKCAQRYKLKNIIRATGDNPFVDIEAASKLLRFYLSEKIDYSHSLNSMLPKGLGLEIFSYSALQKSWKHGIHPHHREHVNEYVIENPNDFKIKYLPSYLEKDFSSLSLTVDTPNEFLIAENIYLLAEKQKVDLIDLHWIIKNISTIFRY